MFRRVSVVLSGVALVWAGACSSSYEEKDVFPAKPGFVMPDASSRPMAESAACLALTDALNAARTRLNCTAEAPACPAYIRPPGGRLCAEYDQSTVLACRSVIEAYSSCDELTSKRCIVTVLDTDDSRCVVPQDGGADDADVSSDASDSGGDASDGGRDAAADAARDAPAG